MTLRTRVIWALTSIVVLTHAAITQQAPQIPSPMADTTRPHIRVAQQQPPGRRVELTSLKGATLFINPRLKAGKGVPLVIHFHGAPWLIESHVADHLTNAALITVQLGSGSNAYNRPFDATATFGSMLEEAKQAMGSGTSWSSVTLTGWSAGYGAIRAILRDEKNFRVVDNVLLLDGIHASYSPEGKPLAEGGVVNEKDLDAFIAFASEATAGRKHLVITHSEIFPGTYASTTECVDQLLRLMHITRHPDLKKGRMGMQQLSSAGAKGFQVRGYAGNSAPDHVDHIHSMPEWLKLLKIK